MSENTRASLLLMLTAVMWSTGGLFIKLVNWNALAIAGTRSLIACAVFAVFILARRQKLVVNRQTLFCAFTLAVTLLLFVSANKLTTSANAVILQSSSPVHIVWMGTLFFHHRYQRRDYIAVGITMAGILLFFCDSLTPGNLIGNLLGLLNGVAMAAMTITTSRLPDTQSASSALLLGHAMTALAGLPFLLMPGNNYTAQSFLCLLFLGIFQLGIPYLLYGLCAQRTPPLLCSLIVMLEPLLNPMWVFVFTGEYPGVFAMLGGAVVLLTVTLWCMGNVKNADAA